MCLFENILPDSDYEGGVCDTYSGKLMAKISFSEFSEINSLNNNDKELLCLWRDLWINWLNDFFSGKCCNSTSSPSFNNFRRRKCRQNFSIWSDCQQFVNSCATTTTASTTRIWSQILTQKLVVFWLKIVKKKVPRNCY